MVDTGGAGSKDVAVGIDLGTTHSVVAAYKAGKVEIFANDNGSRTTPSIVGFMGGEAYIGDAAKDLPAALQIYDAKRLIGRSWQDDEVQRDRASWPFEVVEEKGTPRIKVHVSGKEETFAPEQISAMVLQNLKETAERMLEQTVTKAVVTVPAYFNERQRQATKDACKIAGLQVLSIINEPTAAAIAYGVDNKPASKTTVCVYDLGGGTFDVSVMEIVGSDYRVLASGGDTRLGGQDFDLRLLDHCVEDIKRKHGIDLRASKDKDVESLHEVRKACEAAKRRLSSFPEARLTAFLPGHDLTYVTGISRAFFEGLCMDLFNATTTMTKQVLAEATVPLMRLDELVLVGGSTRIPKVRSMLKDLFGGKELRNSINPDEAVAYGAAVRAASLADSSTAAGVGITLKDVTPLSLGIDITEDRFSIVIPRNTPIPCRKTKAFCTSVAFSKSVRIKVYQGERPMVKDNYFLNKEFVIAVPPKPAGEAKVDVTFEIDAEGLLTVTAVEPTTGAQRHVTITASEAHLSEKDIVGMIETAKRFRREDEEALRQKKRKV